LKYTTKDLSRILGVSGNTIRRYDEMGYLTGIKNEENGYRQFSNEDVERLMYVTKYRKEELSHETVENLLKSTPDDIVHTLEKKRNIIRERIAYYKAIDHLLKDDIMLMKLARRNLDEFIYQECQPMHFIRYMKDGKLDLPQSKAKLIQSFMEKCPEFYYMYLLESQGPEKGRFMFSEGIGANTLMTSKYGFVSEDGVELYEQRPCVLRFVKIPIKDELPLDELTGPVLEHIETKGLKTDGDVMILKIGCFYEEGRLMQYLLMHFPVRQ